MPPTPLIVALARMRLPSALSIPRRVSAVAYIYLLAKVPHHATAFYKMLMAYMLWLAGKPKPFVRCLVKLLHRLIHGRKKALLIGIRQVPELPQEDPIPIVTTTAATDVGTGSPDASSIPDRPRAMRKIGAKKPKVKAKKAKVAAPETQGALRGPHHDVKSMQALLIAKFGYHPDDIVVLIDDGEQAHLQPTRPNVLSQIKNLVKDAQDGDKLFFHYAGHADQVDTDDIEEEDGKNECILTSDGFAIMDDELKAEIVEPLRNIKCTLTAVLDCCHSGSLLDLPHIHCNDVYVPWLNKGRRRTKTLWADCTRSSGMYTPPEATDPESPSIPLDVPLVIAPRKNHPKPMGLVIDTSLCYPTPPLTHESRKPSFDEHHHEIPDIDVTDASPVDHNDDSELSMFVSPERFMGNSPVAQYEYCTGTCRDNFLLRRRDDITTAGVEVICISAAKDNELAWEDGEGKSMTQYLVHNLYTKPKPTLQTLMTSISHDIHSYYVSDLHQKARAYKKKMNALNNGHSSEDATALIVEMHNFQNPQLSSLIPMNMEQIFDP